MSRFYKIFFVLKKGDLKKYKPHLKYVNDTYSPHYLTFSQEIFYDNIRSKPIPIIEFKVFARDAIHFMDDFIENFPKALMTGGAEPFKWLTYKPTKKEKDTATMLEKLFKKRIKKFTKRKKNGR